MSAGKLSDHVRRSFVINVLCGRIVHQVKGYSKCFLVMWAIPHHQSDGGRLLWSN